MHTDECCFHRGVVCTICEDMNIVSIDVGSAAEELVVHRQVVCTQRSAMHTYAHRGVWFAHVYIMYRDE